MTRKELIDWHVEYRSSELGSMEARKLCEESTNEWLLKGYDLKIGVGNSRSSPVYNGVGRSSRFSARWRTISRSNSSQSSDERGPLGF